MENATRVHVSRCDWHFYWLLIAYAAKIFAIVIQR